MRSIWPLFIFQPHFLLLPIFTLCLRNRNYLQLLDHIILLFSLLPRVSYIYFPLYLGVSHPLFPGLLHFASGVPAWKSSCPGILLLWAGWSGAYASYWPRTMCLPIVAPFTHCLHTFRHRTEGQECAEFTVSPTSCGRRLTRWLFHRLRYMLSFKSLYFPEGSPEN